MKKDKKTEHFDPAQFETAVREFEKKWTAPGKPMRPAIVKEIREASDAEGLAINQVTTHER